MPDIRWMIRRDMPEVLAIEAASFPEPMQWTEEDFFAELRQRNCIGMVAEINERIVGYMVYVLQKKSLELINIAVFPPDRREGVGTAMIDKLKRKIGQQRRESITLTVGDWNLGAHRFFSSCGFCAVGVQRGHFSDGSDGYKFVWRPQEQFRTVNRVQSLMGDE